MRRPLFPSPSRARTSRRTPPARARFTRAALAAAAAAAAAAACALLTVGVKARVPQDLMREFHVRYEIGHGYRQKCARHGDMPLLRPDFRFESWSPNLTFRYTTAAVPMGECSHAFRLNGAGDDAPVHGAVLGDSYSENLRLDDAEGWVSLLSQATGRRFANLGCTGAGTGDHLKTAETFFPFLKPRAVILQLTNNDLREDFFGHRPVPSMTQEQEAAAAALQLANIDRIRALCLKFGAPLAIVLFDDPGYAETLRLPDWCRRNGVPLFFVDRLSWPAGDPDRRRFAFDAHYNAASNRFIADGIREFLKDWPGLARA
jgi:hypothetical protein